MPMTPEELSAGLKAKYPQYKDVPDEVLLPKLFDKHPIYQKHLVQPSNAQEVTQVPEDDFLRRKVPAILEQSRLVPAQVAGKVLRNLPYQGNTKPSSESEVIDTALNITPMGIGGAVEKVVQRSGLELHLLDLLKKNLPTKNQALTNLAQKDPVQALKSGLPVTEWPKVDRWINELKNLGHEGADLEVMARTKAKVLIDEVNGVPGLEVPSSLPSNAKSTGQVVPAVRDPQSGQVFTGPSHNEIMASVTDPNAKRAVMREVLGKTENTGFRDADGQFINRAQAQEKYGFSTSEELLQMGQPKVQEAVVQAPKALEVPKQLTPAQEKAKLNKELASTPNVDPFFLKTTKVLEEKGIPESMPSKGLLNLLLKKQVKPDEIKWSGLDKFLEGKERVTKAEVQQYLKENDFHVNEIELTGNFKKAEGDPDNLFQYGPDTHPDLQIPGATRHEETLYQLPQKTEMVLGDIEQLFTTPAKYIGDNVVYEDVTGGKLIGTARKGWRYEDINGKQIDLGIIGGGSAADAQLTALYKVPGLRASMPLIDKPITKGFQGGHYEEPNIIAHVLRDEIKLGKDKVSLLNEKQSDWHQIGGKEGYQTKTISDVVDTMTNTELRSYIRKVDANGYASLEDEVLNNTEELRQVVKQNLKEGLWAEPESIIAKGVPDAPFKKNWNLLIDKREIRRAVERKQDGIAWPAGEVIADRYNVRKHLDELHYKKEPNGTYTLMYTKRNELEAQPFHHNVTKEALPSIVGKELANDIMHEVGEPNNLASMEGNHMTINMLRDKPLVVGGEWHKKMYDEKFVNDLNAFVKPFGARMEKIKYQPKGIKKLSSSDKEDLLLSLDRVRDANSSYEDLMQDLNMHGLKLDEDLFENWSDFNRAPYTRLTSNQMLKDLLKHQTEKAIPMWYLKFTPALKRAALKEGFPLFVGIGVVGLTQADKK